MDIWFRYTIPLLVKDGELYSLRSSAKYANCRDASLNLGDQVSSVDMWATKTVNSFGEILDWCNGNALTITGEYLLRVCQSFGVYSEAVSEQLQESGGRVSEKQHCILLKSIG